MATVAILTLGEMVERVMIGRICTASTCANPDMIYEGLTNRWDGTTPRSMFNFSLEFQPLHINGRVWYHPYTKFVLLSRNLTLPQNNQLWGHFILRMLNK